MPEQPHEQQVLGQFIPLHYHYNMLTDGPRMSGFRQALELVVPPGGKALELGGGTGVLSFFASRSAAKVWCVERNPELAREARRILALNGAEAKVEVVEADALEYLPPESVDVVICEMLHVGLLREKQVEMIAAFKARYSQRFGPKLPVFVPEASLQAIQPVEQTFEFEGYYAPVPLFQDPGLTHTGTRELAPPAMYQMVDYSAELPTSCAWQGTCTLADQGTLNAVRFITKNVLAISVAEQRSIDWYNQHLVMPLDQPLAVSAGETVAIRFSYAPGAQLDELASSLRVERLKPPIVG